MTRSSSGLVGGLADVGAGIVDAFGIDECTGSGDPGGVRRVRGAWVWCVVYIRRVVYTEVGVNRFFKLI